jgi:hypothetical protein
MTADLEQVAMGQPMTLEKFTYARSLRDDRLLSHR